jgi:hypothetical protein
MVSTQATETTKGAGLEESTPGSEQHLNRFADRNAVVLGLNEVWRYFRQLHGLEVTASYFALIGSCL